MAPSLVLLIRPLRTECQLDQRTSFPLRQKEHVRILALAPSLVTKRQVSIISMRFALPRRRFSKNTRGWRLILKWYQVFLCYFDLVWQSPWANLLILLGEKTYNRLLILVVAKFIARDSSSHSSSRKPSSYSFSGLDARFFVLGFDIDSRPSLAPSVLEIAGFPYLQEDITSKFEVSAIIAVSPFKVNPLSSEPILKYLQAHADKDTFTVVFFNPFMCFCRLNRLVSLISVKKSANLPVQSIWLSTFDDFGVHNGSSA